VEDGWKYGDEVIVQRKLVEPPGECRSDYRICADLAERLGIGDVFTERRDERGWAEFCIDELRRRRFNELPSLDELLESNAGVWARPVRTPAVAFADFRKDPEAFPLSTPTGKIEIFSRQLFDLHRPEEVPPLPKYIQEWESPFTSADYPLQAIGHHTLHRVHSTHDNNDWLEEAFPQRVFINPLDASSRGIADGDQVKVFNDRGALVLPCRVTPRIMPGVVDIPQGAWWAPDSDSGLDRGGNVNVLTSLRWTPFAFASAQHTIMVEVERWSEVRTSSGILSRRARRAH
jgi:anaerobic dimethyl sulfoxide reductase subunit A